MPCGAAASRALGPDPAAGAPQVVPMEGSGLGGIRNKRAQKGGIWPRNGARGLPGAGLGRIRPENREQCQENPEIAGKPERRSGLLRYPPGPGLGSVWG